VISLLGLAALITAFSGSALAQSQQGPYTARLWIDNNGLPQRTTANWTQNTSGSFRFQHIVENASFQYHYHVYDLTVGPWAMVDEIFSTTSPTCTTGQEYVSLVAGHRYQMDIDIPLGLPTTATPLARVVIEYTCQGQ
jgi:hypothetical protein